MMNKQIANALLAACGMTLGLALLSAGSASAQAIVSSESAEGSVELSNISATDTQTSVAVDAPAEAASATPTAEQTTAEAPKDPREQYRDRVMKEPEDQPSFATTATSRRYKKMDKAAYQASMLDSASQAAPTLQGSR